MSRAAPPGGLVCGLDEAGRGPLAGPLCAAAVIIGPDFPAGILDDSKKLSEKKREAAAGVIRGKAFALGVGWASWGEIDEINVLRASLLAMRRAFDAMAGCPIWPRGDFRGLYGDFRGLYNEKVSLTVADGPYAPALPVPCKPLVRADSSVPAVMAASIIAKTERDREMRRLALLYPEYKYEKHKGYPTKEHRALIAKFGPSPVQRLTFRPGKS